MRWGNLGKGSKLSPVWPNSEANIDACWVSLAVVTARAGLRNFCFSRLGLRLEILGYDCVCVPEKNKGFEEANCGEIRERLSRRQEVEIERIEWRHTKYYSK